MVVSKNPHQNGERAPPSSGNGQRGRQWLVGLSLPGMMSTNGVLNHLQPIVGKSKSQRGGMGNFTSLLAKIPPF